jgi:hypothetical protein
VSPVKYEMGFYIPKDDILHSHCRHSDYARGETFVEILNR